MPDIFTISAKQLLHEAMADLKSAIRGASRETLNRKPGGEDTNSIAVLATHAMHSTRSWLSIAVGAPLPERDRDAEFVATSPGADALVAFADGMQTDCERLLDGADSIDWDAMRPTHARPRAGDPAEVPAAWALLHALEHLREHTGQMLLTRQLLDGRAG